MSESLSDAVREAAQGEAERKVAAARSKRDYRRGNAMSEYTPGTSEAREQFARGARGGYGGSAEAGAHRHVAAQNEFDRWLAKHDAEVECAAAEKAWDEGEQAGYEDALGEQRGIRPNESARNPYRRGEA